MVKIRKPLHAGFGRADITPLPGVRLGGYPIEDRIAENILDKLEATSLVLEQSGLKTAIINLDWITIEEDTVECIRAGVNEKTGIPKENISVCASHTHSAPPTRSAWGFGERDDHYIQSFLPEIIRSAELADQNLQEVAIGLATTPSLVGVNRRGITENNAANAFLADANGSIDLTMTVLHFKSLDGADAGIVIHYGAHGTAMGPTRSVSRDWPGVMKDRIESQFPVPVLFLNGAEGDVGPRINNRDQTAGAGDGIHAVREVGYRAATDAIQALLSIKEYQSCLELKVHSEDIFLHYAPLIPLAEAECALLKWAPRKNEWGMPMCEYRYNKAVVDAYQKPAISGKSFRQSIIGFGPLAFVPMPGETFSGISLRLRKLSPFQHTLCCSCCNATLCYLPTREARHRGGYEIWAGKPFGAYLLADDIDDQLVRENIRMLRCLASKDEIPSEE